MTVRAKQSGGLMTVPMSGPKEGYIKREVNRRGDLKLCPKCKDVWQWIMIKENTFEVLANFPRYGLLEESCPKCLNKKQIPRNRPERKKKEPTNG